MVTDLAGPQICADGADQNLCKKKNCGHLREQNPICGMFIRLKKSNIPHLID
jgi:hypothetical protein